MFRGRGSVFNGPVPVHCLLVNSSLYFNSGQKALNAATFVSFGTKDKFRHRNLNVLVSDGVIMQTCPCNEAPLTPHFYKVKLDSTDVYIFPYFCTKHRLWALVIRKPRY